MSYLPNKFSLSKRLWNTIASIFLIGYGGYGIINNDLYIPGKRNGGIHLTDAPAIMMYGAFICGVLVMLSTIIDHYDERDNEHKYKQFAKILKFCGWSLFGFALFFNLLGIHS